MSSLANARSRVEESPPRAASAARSMPCANILLQTSASVAIVMIPLIPRDFRGLQHFHRAQLGASRRRIPHDLLFGGPHYVPGEQLSPPFFRHGLKAMLHFAILQRHEGENHRSSTFPHTSRNGF